MRSLRHDVACALDPSLLLEGMGLTPDTWQQDVLRSDRDALLLCSRQAGKSTTAAVAALHEALYHPPALVLLLSPSLRQSQELFRRVLLCYRALGGREVIPLEAESALRLELTNGSRIVSLPGTETTVRGYSGARLLVIDEAARVDDGLYYATRPMLAVSRGRLVMLSTPAGRRGAFYEEWVGPAPWLRVEIPAEACPRISPEFLEQERAHLGGFAYAQEYECRFVEDATHVFTADMLRTALTAPVPPLFGDARLS